LALVGSRRQIGARFGARCGSLPQETLAAQAVWDGGEGRNRPSIVANDRNI